MKIANKDEVYTAEQYLYAERNTLREDYGKFHFYKNKRLLVDDVTKVPLSKIYQRVNFEEVEEWMDLNAKEPMMSKSSALLRFILRG